MKLLLDKDAFVLETIILMEITTSTNRYTMAEMFMLLDLFP
jgi:hypothetical protein